MSNHIFIFISVAGPAKSIAAWAERMVASRQTFSDGKGSHWGEAFGLFHADSAIAPRLNEGGLSDNPPPGEAYATLCGYWLGRHWTATEVGLAFGTIASLFPDLTLFFGADHYEEDGMRGLWTNGACVVFDVCDPVDGRPTSDEVDRRVHPVSPIPDYYAPFFAFAAPPDWDEVRKSIEAE